MNAHLPTKKFNMVLKEEEERGDPERVIYHTEKNTHSKPEKNNKGKQQPRSQTRVAQTKTRYTGKQNNRCPSNKKKKKNTIDKNNNTKFQKKPVCSYTYILLSANPTTTTSIRSTAKNKHAPKQEGKGGN